MKPALFSLLFASSALAQSITAVEHAPPKPPAIEYRLSPTAPPPPPDGPDFTAQTTLYSIGNPTDEEQYYVELINRARANPTAEGIMLADTEHPNVKSAIDFFNVDLNMMKAEFALLPPRPPLALNEKLTNAARGHTQFQFDTATQTHTGSGGSDVGDRIDAAGYDLSTAGESVFTTAQDVFHGHAGFQIDWGNDGGAGGMQLNRGHRMNNHGNFREIGVGVILGNNTVGTKKAGPQVVTQNFASALPNNQAFVTGVAYYDVNANSIFDPGEGIGGLTVTVAGANFHAVTAATGGYTVPVPVPDATYAVTFTGLGANGGGNAQITGGANVKVDFKPAYTPPTPAGLDVASTVAATNYTFNAVIGATGYKSRSVANVNAAADDADNLDRVTAATSGSYAVNNANAYRLGHVSGGGDQMLTYKNSFHVKANASLNFLSKHGLADPTQTARVEVSTNGGLTWEAVFTQAGSGGAGETSFQARNISLAAYVGKDIRLRFNYGLVAGQFWPVTNATAGWFINTITFTNLVDLTGATTTTLPAGTTFAFTAPAVGDLLLSVSPIISGKDFGFGPPKAVTAIAAPPNLSEITVEQVGGGALTSGGTVNFGTRMLNDDETLTFKIRNDGTEDLTLGGFSTTGANQGEFLSSGTGVVNLLIPGAEVNFTITFTAVTQGVRTAKLQIANGDTTENPFEINLTGTATNAPTIDTPPGSIVTLEGGGATFSVAASHPNLVPTFQWKKNNVNIKNATTDTLDFAVVKATDVGTYTVVVSAGGESVTSPPVTLAVVKPVTQLQVLAHGTKLKLTVTVTGAAELAWTKTHGNPQVTDPILGQTGKILDLGTLDVAASSAVYRCEATPPGGGFAVTAGEFDVRVFNFKPQVTKNQGLPDGAVGSFYFHQILLNGGLDESPVSYSAKNLPTGLTLNTKLGTITGVPTVPKTFFKVSVTATNAKGSTFSDDQNIIIAPLPGGVAGTFVGSVAREPTLNANLGGRVDFTIASTGVISGSFTMGTLKHPFKSVIQIDTVPPLDPPSAFINVPRTGKTPLFFLLELDPANNVLAANTNVSDGGNTAAIAGWRNVWSTLNLATPAAKLYTYALKPPAAMPTVPRGDGYGSFTLGKDGKLTAAGKLADGEGHTCAAYAGPQGQILIFQTFTTTKGSVLGTLDIDHDNDGVMDDDGLAGSLSWLRPVNLKSRVYPGGFGPIDITAVGSRYTPPVAPALVLGMALGDKAKITFADGGLAGAAIDPNVDEFDILAGNKVSFIGATNPGTVKITALSATTGVFTGTFTLDDDELRGGTFAGKKLKRTTTFNGILTNDGVAPVGLGHFLLAEMPHDAPGATTPTTSPQFSGSVLLEKK